MPTEIELPNTPVEIPSFRQGREKEKRGSLFAPGVHVRGTRGGPSWMERLRQFRKKDLAFMASGIGVLFMAPVAEHILLGPKSHESTMRPGFSQKRCRTLTF